jgi:hypothetical protein
MRLTFDQIDRQLALRQQGIGAAVAIPFALYIAKRIMTKECLWLIRINPLDTERLHEAELMGGFKVQLAAIYASLSQFFLKDPLEKKK